MKSITSTSITSKSQVSQVQVKPNQCPKFVFSPSKSLLRRFTRSVPLLFPFGAPKSSCLIQLFLTRALSCALKPANTSAHLSAFDPALDIISSYLSVVTSSPLGNSLKFSTFFEQIFLTCNVFHSITPGLTT